jgi:hypothetical protein
MDFWRMVVEHNVATMVVLSSEGEFWQYWPLDQGDKVGQPSPPPPVGQPPHPSGSGIRCLFDPWVRDPGFGIGFLRIRVSGPGYLTYIFKSLLTIF